MGVTQQPIKAIRLKDGSARGSIFKEFPLTLAAKASMGSESKLRKKTRLKEFSPSP